MPDITHLLHAAASGDRRAAADVLPLVYDELRRLAAARLTRETPGHTLQPTALVHEAYLRLVGAADDAKWDSRGHFFFAAAEAMRRILVESARRKGREKHGGKQERVSFDPDLISGPERAVELLALDEAMTELATSDPDAARLVSLRYFAGLSVDDAAAALGVSPRTAAYTWAYARAWLRDRLEGGEFLAN